MSDGGVLMARQPAAGGRGRKLSQKVRKGKLKASSRRWIERHINDPYVQRARPRAIARAPPTSCSRSTT